MGYIDIGVFWGILIVVAEYQIFFEKQSNVDWGIQPAEGKQSQDSARRN